MDWGKYCFRSGGRRICFEIIFARPPLKLEPLESPLTVRQKGTQIRLHAAEFNIVSPTIHPTLSSRSFLKFPFALRHLYLLGGISQNGAPLDYEQLIFHLPVLYTMY